MTRLSTQQKNMIAESAADIHRATAQANRNNRIELLQAARDGLLMEGIVVVVLFLLLAVAVNASSILDVLDANGNIAGLLR